MIKIHFKNEGIAIERASVGSLKNACLESAKNPLPLGCQKGRCGTCLVRVLDSSAVLPPNEIERAFLNNHRISDPNLRLGCQLQVAGNAVIETLEAKTATFRREMGKDISGHFPEIGFSTNVLDNPADVVGSVNLLSGNFKAIELELGDRAEEFVSNATPVQYQKTVRQIRAICEERGITLSVHAPYVGQNLSSEDRDVRKHSTAKLQ